MQHINNWSYKLTIKRLNLHKCYEGNKKTYYLSLVLKDETNKREIQIPKINLPINDTNLFFNINCVSRDSSLPNNIIEYSISSVNSEIKNTQEDFKIIIKDLKNNITNC